MLELILLRHGNTFAPGEKVVWVGSSLDLPLVPTGVEQAKACAGALSALKSRIGAVFCGPLRRTREYAGILCDELKLPFLPEVDPRLNELDYGGWSGLSKEEVSERFGAEALRTWEKECVWPRQSGWGGSEGQVIDEVRSFVGEVAEGQGGPGGTKAVLVVSSNGRLRYFLRLARDEFVKRVKSGEFSVRTGGICRMTGGLKDMTVSDWNLTPAEFTARYKPSPVSA